MRGPRSPLSPLSPPLSRPLTTQPRPASQSQRKHIWKAPPFIQFTQWCAKGPHALLSAITSNLIYGFFQTIHYYLLFIYYLFHLPTSRRFRFSSAAASFSTSSCALKMQRQASSTRMSRAWSGKSLKVARHRASQSAFSEDISSHNSRIRTLLVSPNPHSCRTRSSASWMYRLWYTQAAVGACWARF